MSYSKQKKLITFTIRSKSGNKVFVAGTFNGWCPTKYQLQEDRGTYTTSMILPKGLYEYKFIINNIWCVDPECPNTVPNGLGSQNSLLMVS